MSFAVKRVWVLASISGNPLVEHFTLQESCYNDIRECQDERYQLPVLKPVTLWHVKKMLLLEEAQIMSHIKGMQHIATRDGNRKYGIHLQMLNLSRIVIMTLRSNIFSWGEIG